MAYNQPYNNQPPYGGGYGQPPPGQYGGGGPPAWGAPPPQQGYNQPPPSQYGGGGYGAPPPPQGAPYGAPYGGGGGYGAPPPPNPYGPPPGQYGGPPPPGPGYPPAGPQRYPAAPQPYGAAPQGYGQPPPPSGPLTFLHTPIPAPPPAPPLTQLQGYNPSFDTDRLRKAMKGFGTDENALIDVLAPLDPFQMEVLGRTYQSMVGKTLRKDLESELSGWLENGLVLLALGPLHADIHLIHRACAGFGTHEDLLTEILIHRTNQEIFLLKQGYKEVYGKDLESVVKGELSMKTERMFLMALAGSRDESTFVNHQLVQQDVEELYRAGAAKMGTDEIKFCGILQSRSDAHLSALSQAYFQRHSHTLTQVVHGEFSGHMQQALLHITRCFEPPSAHNRSGNPDTSLLRDAEDLEAAMHGAGTKDERLIWRIVRGHWSRGRWEEVKRIYAQRYGRELKGRVKGETTGKYERMLLAIIN